MPILWPLKVPERGNAITQRKTLEIEHSCLFIHHTISIYPFPHLILFNTPKKSLLKSSYPSQIFVPKKIPESKISNPKKSFDHPRHLKSRVPSLGDECNLASMKTHCKDVNYSSHINSGQYPLILELMNLNHLEEQIFYQYIRLPDFFWKIIQS